MSDLLSATLAPVRVTEATKASVAEVAGHLGLSEADVVRLSLRFYLSGWRESERLAEITGAHVPPHIGTPAGDA